MVMTNQQIYDAVKQAKSHTELVNLIDDDLGKFKAKPCYSYHIHHPPYYVITRKGKQYIVGQHGQYFVLGHPCKVTFWEVNITGRFISRKGIKDNTFVRGEAECRYPIAAIMKVLSSKLGYSFTSHAIIDPTPYQEVIEFSGEYLEAHFQAKLPLSQYTQPVKEDRFMTLIGAPKLL